LKLKSLKLVNKFELNKIAWYVLSFLRRCFGCASDF
jgi:hypothetical protein